MVRLGYLCCLLGRTRTLDSHASRLRRKLNRNGAAAYVINVWGVDYRLVADAEPRPDGWPTLPVAISSTSEVADCACVVPNADAGR
jgi:hypothetical protein